MLARFIAVVTCILTAVWLARAPDWEPAVGLFVAFFGYLGIEFQQHQKEKGEKDGRRVRVRKGKISSDEEVSILAHIASHGPKEASQLSAELGLSKIKGEVLCTELEAKGFLDLPTVWIDTCPYYLTQRAKEYLLAKGVVE